MNLDNFDFYKLENNNSAREVLKPMAELLDETYGAMASVSFDNNLADLGMQYAELQTQVQIIWDS